MESCGFVITDGDAALAMSGDTGPTDKLWKVLNKTQHLKALLLETSFPNELQDLADISGHLTPATLRSELAQVQPQRRPGAALPPQARLRGRSSSSELAGLPVEVLELGETFELSSASLDGSRPAD